MGADVKTAPVAEASIEVWEDNWRTFCAFLDLSSQWRWQSDGERHWLSLDYAGADVVLRRKQYDDVNFGDLQLMERAAIDAFEGR